MFCTRWTFTLTGRPRLTICGLRRCARAVFLTYTAHGVALVGAMYGPVVCDPESHAFVGVSRLSSNAAELHALMFAVWGISGSATGGGGVAAFGRLIRQRQQVPSLSKKTVTNIKVIPKTINPHEITDVSDIANFIETRAVSWSVDSGAHIQAFTLNLSRSWPVVDCAHIQAFTLKLSRSRSVDW